MHCSLQKACAGTEDENESSRQEDLLSPNHTLPETNKQTDTVPRAASLKGLSVPGGGNKAMGRKGIGSDRAKMVTRPDCHETFSPQHFLERNRSNPEDI